MPLETVSVPKSAIAPGVGVGGGGGGFLDRGWGGGGDDSGPFRGKPRGLVLETYKLGVWLGLIATTMLFIALSSALIVRRGISFDWETTRMPRLFYLNTAVLVASSLTLEYARRAMRAGLRHVFRRWWLATTLLGLVFLAGQWTAWGQLSTQGVFLGSNPSASFLYLLSGAHWVHLLGGVIALVYVAIRDSRPAMSAVPVETTALYWHFMDGLWLYLLVVLLYWR
jgi:cytochrome c oxidase subunit 3